MAIELKDEEDTWTISDADLIEGGDKDTIYTVRRLTLDKHREILKRHTKPATYRRPERRDEPKIQDDIFDYVLAGWKGFVGKGAELPCVWQYKRLVDVARRTALINDAGMNDIAAAEGARVESFPRA